MSGAVTPLPYAFIELKYGETLPLYLQEMKQVRQPSYNVSIPVPIQDVSRL
jgi:hypothetical protein